MNSNIAFLLTLLLFVLSGCGGGVMESGPPPEGAEIEEPVELSEEEMEQEAAADPNAE